MQCVRSTMKCQSRFIVKVIFGDGILMFGTIQRQWLTEINCTENPKKYYKTNEKKYHEQHNIVQVRSNNHKIGKVCTIN